jgi:glycosyltransferase involved in cell wall biosynthesis
MKIASALLNAGISLSVNSWSNWRAKQVIRQRMRRYPLQAAGRVVVYTAIHGGKDALREARSFPGVDYVCFSDDASLRPRTWKMVVARNGSDDPRMRAKVYKILPHRYFPDHEYSIWVDGTHVPVVDPRYLVLRYLGTNDIALFRHPLRHCLYDEMQACLTQNKGGPQDIRRQRDRYLAEGYPSNNGLATCTVILRRHHSPHVIPAMEEWWEEITRYSARDQLSFNYVTHRRGLAYSVIPGHVYNNHYFRFAPHGKPDSSALSVGWILNGGRETASARIMGDNVNEYLVSCGVFSKILFRPESRITSRLQLARSQIDKLLNHNINVLVIVKLDEGRNLNYLFTQCRRHGIKVVYAVCDLPSSRMLSAADAVIATSEEFRMIVPRKYLHKLHVVFDGYEHEPSLKKCHQDGRTLKLCLVTNHVWDGVPCIPELPKGVSLKIIGPGPEILSTSFRRSRVFRDSPFDFEYVPWREDTVMEEVLDCDAGIIPWPDIGTAERLKSANRLVLFMSLGMPVIASPVPSYLKIVRSGENGYIAAQPREWLESIESLRDDPAGRRTMGETARNEIVDRYSKDQQGRVYLQILKKILEGEGTAAGRQMAIRELVR